MPVHLIPKVPERYKRNTINCDLNQSYQISMNFDNEKETVREKYRLVGFPNIFFGNGIRQFHQKLINNQAEYEPNNS